jgi:cytochrome c oxidase cbb3-type subunit 4
MVTLVAMCLTFALVVLYALWPNNRRRFDDAADIPFKEDSEP